MKNKWVFDGSAIQTKEKNDEVLFGSLFFSNCFSVVDVDVFY